MTATAANDGFILPQLVDESAQVYFAPVRHHSPVCARAVADLIREVRPKQVLIEGPPEIEALIAVLTDPATRGPVAVVALQAETPRRTSDEPSAQEPRAISYFPLCDYSPEFVALRAAHADGARIAFIDLPVAHRLMTVAPGRPSTLLDERAIDMSAYVRALCRETGCRDHNEVWDHLFEQRLFGADWRTAFAAVGAYCAAVRATIPSDDLARDGTLAREAAMRAALRAARARPERPILVVTGGLHTSALDDTADDEPASRDAATPAHAANCYVIRYGFRELDRLHGYAAGMPSPAWYQRLATTATAPDALRHLAAATLTDFTAHLRASHPSLVPPLPAVANALEHALRLADLRGMPGPGRQDIRDAAAACFVKGELVAGSAPILDAFDAFLVGDVIGDVPPSAGSPPLVEHVRRAARSFAFDIERGLQKTRDLDIHRNDRHLAASRFLHALAFLDVGFATRIAGPDILAGQMRAILIETWRVAWSPRVEARLVELAIHGDDLASVLAHKLDVAIHELSTEANGNASAGVRLLIKACLIGMQARCEPVFAAVDAFIATDPDLASVTRALSELFLLWRSRALVGLAGSSRLEALVEVAYRRALALATDIETTREERTGDVLNGLAILREVMVSAGRETPAIDGELFSATLQHLLARPLAPELSGAVSALAFLSGTVDAEFLIARSRGQLAGAFPNAADTVAALRGMIAMSRELLWRVPDLLSELDRTISSFDDAQFLETLPHLRRAFAALDPRETDTVAARIADAHTATGGATATLATVSYDVTEDEVAANLADDLALREGLAHDGLGHWLKHAEAPS